MLGHNFDHENGTVCKKCGKIHRSARLGDHRTFKDRFSNETIGEIKKKWKASRFGKKPWNLGKTKENDEKVRQASEKIYIATKSSTYTNSGMFRKGNVPWNKGETKETDSRILKYSQKLSGHPAFNPNVFNEWKERNNIVSTYPRLRYIEELGHYVRSSWEEKFALELLRGNIHYEYEPRTFIVFLEGKLHKYTPDFYINGYYIEIKSFIYLQKVKIINAFIEQYPNIKYIVVGLDKCNNVGLLKCRVISWVDMKCVIGLTNNQY